MIRALDGLVKDRLLLCEDAGNEQARLLAAGLAAGVPLPHGNLPPQAVPPHCQTAGFHQGEVCNYIGGMIPFATTKALRAAGDPRPSLEERYGTHAGYVLAVTNAANKAVAEGYLLPDDAAVLIQQAGASNVLCSTRSATGVCLTP